MIKLAGQLCYSPFPPERYAGPHAGLGISCRHDVQLWNLLYLTCAGIDDHLDPPSDDYIFGLVNRDLNAYAMSLAALTGPNCMELFPGLRDALKQHPSVFLKELWTMPWENLPQVRQNPDWRDIVIDKVADIWARARSPLLTTIPGIAGNFFGG